MSWLKHATLVAVVASSMGAVGCRNPVVLRDPDVYKNEIAFMQMAFEQNTELLAHHLADGSCSCEDGAWTTVECADTALNILVIRHRLDWHVAMMMFLGNQTKERPPEVPPEVPEPDTLCSSDG
jgi:hypothetical protein